MYDMQIAKMMGILKECDEGGVMILESYVGRNIWLKYVFCIEGLIKVIDKEVWIINRHKFSKESNFFDFPYCRAAFTV